VHADDRQEVAAHIERCRVSGESFHFEARVIRADGQVRDVEAIGECERGEDGTVHAIFGVLRDITERKQTERSLRGTTQTLERMVAERTTELQARVRERDLLMHELQHRVKNNLQMISSLVSIQKSRVGGDAQRVLLDVAQRISAIGFVYDIMLHRHEVEKTDLAEVLAGLSTALEKAHGGKVQISMIAEATGCILPAEQVVNLAIVVNELIGNSLRHAFPDGRTGHVTVRIGRIAREWRIVIEDDGIGLVEEPTGAGAGFGLVIVRAILRNLDCRLEHVQQSGTRFDIVLPVSEPAV
jgi:two-component sensor histidine kinase